MNPLILRFRYRRERLPNQAGRFDKIVVQQQPLKVGKDPVKLGGIGPSN